MVVNDTMGTPDRLAALRATIRVQELTLRSHTASQRQKGLASVRLDNARAELARIAPPGLVPYEPVNHGATFGCSVVVGHDKHGDKCCEQLAPWVPPICIENQAAWQGDAYCDEHAYARPAKDSGASAAGDFATRTPPTPPVAGPLPGVEDEAARLVGQQRALIAQFGPANVLRAVSLALADHAEATGNGRLAAEAKALRLHSRMMAVAETVGTLGAGDAVAWTVAQLFNARPERLGVVDADTAARILGDCGIEASTEDAALVAAAWR